ncbi:type I polyketide synthase, partial [Streptomyces sp. NPDC087844]|uniref:type I polyketide synthase n=1 Tax=Streptomyces sp. NPDC087844 TaxID=3365805 RepID=UPI0038261B0B
MTSGTEDKLRQYLKRVTADLGQTRQRLREVEERSQEPVAVVSMACRFPGGVGSPEDLWELVASGADAIGDFPEGRGWDLEGLYDPDPDHPGTSYTRKGGFLYDADRFDAGFFGISPREAQAMEPQQRLLLETSWELLERAGIAPRTLKGSQTGVYAGAGLPGFGTPRVERSAEGHLLTGNALSVLSGRVAFTLGLEGPAVSIDTACSSSLVAIHLACQALRQGECSLALAGGVTVMATPGMFTEFSRQRGLASDGHCKPFADAADGTSLAEGVGLLLLERLSDARRNGHRILAVVRGSAVNQDGASNGLTAPNGPSQERVIRQALAMAGLSSSEVDAVEAHGTGTRLGDPIEAGALLATYGRDRPEGRPLWLGSVKSNIGHTQGAAGVAGVIKMVMAMRHGVLPASLHIDRPSTRVDWSSGSLRLLAEQREWSAGDTPRRAAVSAFGMSGTNAHVILEDAETEAAEPETAAPPPMAGVVPWVVSARSDEAVRGQAGALAEWVDADSGLTPVGVGWSLATARSVFERRAVVLGDRREGLVAGVRALAAGDAHPDVVTEPDGLVQGGGTVFLFSGQGSQRVGMGAGLYGRFPVFASAFDEVCGYLDGELEHPLRQVVFTGVPGHEGLLDHTTYAQAGLFALQVALARLLESAGVRPDAVVGHSVGEIAAAYVAGVFDLRDACRLVAARATLMGALPRGGAMTAIEASAGELEEDLAGCGGRVSVAAVNTPTSTVISGPAQDVARLGALWAGRGRRTKALTVSHAFHSMLMEPMLQEFTEAITDLDYQRPVLPLISNLTGLPAGEDITTPAYWARHIRRPVLFAPAVTHLAPDTGTFLELGPDPVLTTSTQRTLDESGEAVKKNRQPLVTAVLRTGRPDAEAYGHALARLHTAGAEIDWSGWFPVEPTPRTVALPTYAFQRERFRLGAGEGVGDVGAAGLRRVEHELLPAAVALADGGLLLTGRVSVAGEHGWLGDHRILGSVLVPGAALVEWALRAADEAGCAGVDELVLQAPLVLPESGAVQVQVAVDAARDGRRGIRVYSRPEHGDDSAEWTCNAEGVLRAEAIPVPAGERGGPWPTPDARPLDVSAFYERTAAAGYAYGPAFQGVRRVWRDGSDLLAEIELPEAAGGGDGFGIHPALLDAALHPGLLLDEHQQDGAEDASRPVWVPFTWNGVALWADGATGVRVRLSPDVGGAAGERSLRVAVYDAVGAPVLGVDTLVMHPADPEQLRAMGAPDPEGGRQAGELFTLEWTPFEDGDSWVTTGEVAFVGAGTDGWVAVGPGVPSGLVDVSYADLDELLAGLDEGDRVPPVVLAGVPTDSAGPDAVAYGLRLVQGWLVEPRLTDSRLVVVTRGAVAVDAPDPAGAGVWGLIRSAQQEEPGRFALIDLEEPGPDGSGEGVVGGLVHGTATLAAIVRALGADETQAAERDGRLLVPRLTPLTSTTPAQPPRAEPSGDGPADPALDGGTRGPDSTGLTSEATALDPNGTVLVTGGTGTVGALVAEHLVRNWGVRDIVLASRRGADAPGAAELKSALAALGARVRLVAADVADREAVAALVAGIGADHPLTGVVHAAGVLDDATLTAQSPERLARVWGPKAGGAAHLHAATADLPLAMFVMFSSAAACLGSAGQANYAAANAYCDALAVRRRSAGLPGLSMGWTLWAEASGMTGHLTDADLTRLGRAAGAPLSGERALALLDTGARHSSPYLLAADLDRRLLAERPADTLPTPLRTLAAAGRGRVRRAAAVGAHEGSGLASRLAGLDERGRLDAVLDVVAENVAGALGHRAAREIRADASFKDLGFDSLTAVELRNRLAATAGTRLPATLVFDYPTPHALAEYLAGRLNGGVATATATAAAQLSSVTTGAGEPVAIVAMAGRYPGGVTSPEDLWDLVTARRDAVGEFPDDRGWNLDGLFHPDPDHPGTSYAREGGFVHDAAGFDAAFFGVNPREAVAMDPQQRLLLETAWQVLERAGIDPLTLKGSRTGVYAGVMYHDYGVGAAGDDAQLEGYAMLAGSGSVVSGRVAYTLGLEGPAVTVDTACSSSLVAMHLAAQALRQGECTLALAGGVTVLATPEVFTSFSRQRGLARDGRCKAFSAAADGVGWAEGVGLVLLERLSDARRNGHQVLALLRGSAVNQDGASNGLTAPNGPSQERVIRQALANARLSPADVDAVEGHGTGTALGDPIEAQALLATYGQGRPEGRPLWLGSVKSNIGHAQAAAGVAGVIKMVMAMRHGVLPASLHVDEPTPHVDWESGAVRLLTDAADWPASRHPRRAGVSSFGVSGTNAHLILEQAPEPQGAAERPEPERPVEAVPWVLSARSGDGLIGQAAALAAHVDAGREPSPLDVGWSLATTRSAFDRRAVVVGDGYGQLLGGLRSLAAGETHPGVFTSGAAATGESAAGAGRTVFLFSGQGSQRVGMGAGLYGRFPVFASAFDEVCGYLDGELECPLREVVFTGVPGREGLLDHTTYAQAGLFALQVALVRLLESAGVRPDAVVGHSVGEVAAAHVAGVFGLRDACRLVSARATLMGALPRGGAMTAIEASAGELEEDLAGCGGRVSVAAVNTPTSTVISGPAEDVARLGALWAGRGRRTKALTVSHAFHSVLMEPMLQDFTEAITDLDYQRPVLPLISNLTGLPAGEDITTPAYWARHIRQPVLFAPAIAHLASDTGTFLELGPDPVLTTATQHTLDQHTLDHHTLHHTQGATDERPAPLVLSALTHRQPEVHALTRALAQLHTHGTDIDWAGWFPTDPAPHTVQLPTYAFQRERFWLATGGGVGDLGAAGLRRVRHALLPVAVPLADGGLLLTGRVSVAGEHGWLGDHRILGSVLVPGAALVEWALRAADEAGCAGVDELVLQAPLVLPESGAVQVQIVVGAAEPGAPREIKVYSTVERDDNSPDEAEWTCHARGTLGREVQTPADVREATWPPSDAQPLEAGGFYGRVAEAGYAYGPAFQGVRAVWRDGDDLLADVELPEAAGQPGGFGIHPALLDAALHPGLLLEDAREDGRVWLPFAWNDVALWAADAATVRVRLTPLPDADADADGREERRGVRITVADASGGPVLSVGSVMMRLADVAQLAPPADHGVEGQFALEWIPLPESETASGADASLDGEGRGWPVLGSDVFGLAGAETCHSDVESLVAAIDAGSPAPEVVLTCVSTAAGVDAEEGLDTTARVLGLLRVWLAEPGLVGVRLVVVTRGAVVVDG